MSSSAPSVHDASELADPSSPLGAKMQDVVDDLLAEGLLRKIRGFARNRNRWFRLTKQYFAFYSEDAGSLIAYVPRKAIASVTEVSTVRFTIETSVPFGASGQSKMLLEARSANVKARWLAALTQPSSSAEQEEANAGVPARKYIEGFLTKLQMFGSMSRTRWFVLTDTGLTYYTTDGGDELGCCELSNIDSVMPKGETSFILKAHAAFTRTGAATIYCQCSTCEVRDKWIDTLERVLGDARVKAEFAPLPQQSRDVSDRFAVLTKQEWEYNGTNSEGNRFIADNAL